MELVHDYIKHETDTSVMVKGVAMKAKVYDYPELGKRLFKPAEAVNAIPSLIKWVPITLGHTIGADVKANELDQIIGGFWVHDSDDGKLHGTYEFYKDKTPKEILDDVRKGVPIATSTGFDPILLDQTGIDQGKPYDGVQAIMKLGHVAVIPKSMLSHALPRCTIEEGCGVGLDGSELCDATELKASGSLVVPIEPVESTEESIMPDEKPTEDAKPPCQEKAWEAKYNSVIDALKKDILDSGVLKADDLKDINDAASLLAIKKLAAVPTGELKLPIQDAATGEPGNKPFSYADARAATIAKMRERQNARYDATFKEVH